MDIAVMVGNAVQWRFQPHKIDREANTILTPRVIRYPPIPAGADLLCDGEHLGTVSSVQADANMRWLVIYQPVLHVPDPTSLDDAFVASLRDAGLTIRDVADMDEESLQKAMGISARRARDVHRSAMSLVAATRESE